ncbi:MAG TPA: hydroxymethylbilane synthase [Rhodanobacteraceae bacterium]|nr:hydroxymethylbilane synthase [Rhodanobacteraceae bacterium]
MYDDAVLRIATRRSALALWQAEHVAARLRAVHRGLQVELLPMSTRGDELQDRSLAEVGGKGLFLKELERAMADGAADVAVHSLKDVPADLEPGFALAAILERADSADAFVSNGHAGLPELPRGARVGTSSLRRSAQLRAARPDLEVRDLRGNVNTRLAKLDRGDYDAIVLAVAGLQRLDLGERIRARLAPPDWLPAPGQAAIAIECREDDPRVAALARALDDADTRVAARAERALNRALGGSCTVPVGAWCAVEDDALTLHALVGDVASGRLLRTRGQGRRDAAAALGEQLARDLLDQGAGAFLQPQAAR